VIFKVNCSSEQAAHLSKGYEGDPAKTEAAYMHKANRQHIFLRDMRATRENRGGIMHKVKYII
jgi:hypothetical protein